MENTIDEPIGDLEEWMNTLLIDEQTSEDVDEDEDNFDIDSEDTTYNIPQDSTEPKIQTETEDVTKDKLPIIETYVDSLLDAYCMDFKEAAPDKLETNATKEESTDKQKDVNTSEVEKGENPYKPKPEVEKQNGSKDTSELPLDENKDITTDIVKAREKVCAMDQKSIKKQLIHYLIVESLVENE